MNRTAARAGQESGRSDGSRTLTIHDVPTPEAGGSGGAGPSRGGDSPSDGVLRLRGRGDQSDNRRVVWSEGTVDNEGLGRKKSKICCIYHKPKAFDESSDESSSGSDSDSPSSGSDSDSPPASDDDPRDGDGPSVSKAMRDKINGKQRDGRRGPGRSHTHDNADGDDCEHHDHSSRSKSSKSSSKSKRSHKSSSSTMVVTEESQESSHRHGRPPLPSDDDDDDGEDDPRPRPNAYERGPA